MLVQRKWMYLEGIFIGGDIRSQLPEEAKKFDLIDKTFKGIMNETFKQPNIKICETSSQLCYHMIYMTKESSAIGFCAICDNQGCFNTISFKYHSS